MSARPSNVDAIGPETGTALLHRNGIGLIAEDRHLIEALLRAGVARAEIPDDLRPMRAALARRIHAAAADPWDPAHLTCVVDQSRALADRLARKAAE